MPTIESLLQLTGSYGPFIAIALSTFLLVETVFHTITRKRREAASVNKRLKLLEQGQSRGTVLIELRRKRGLSDEGDYVLPILVLNKLLVQSGLDINLSFMIVAMTAVGVIVATLAHLVFGILELAVLLGVVAGVVCPILVLLACRARRRRRLEDQLPEAVDVMVRSLRAGHPIPVSIAMVAREMPDPVGSEFGLVSDELTYGLDLATAMGNLRERTGQIDIALLGVAISIQSKTGGNLAELLSNLARMIRDRYRMRRKIHALSAEGRFSSIALSLIPLAVYLVVQMTTPRYFGDVKGDAWFMPAVYVGLTLWAIGVITIRRMVNFRI
jgi:tight adherence protein B